MKGRRRPSQPSQTRSDQVPTKGETIAPSNDRVFPMRLSTKYELVSPLSQSVNVKLLNALNTPMLKADPR